jgi:hypothetical protein
MTKYLTVVLRVADNAENKLVLDQMDRVNGATLVAASWSHVLDERNGYREALERISNLRDSEESRIALIALRL